MLAGKNQAVGPKEFKAAANILAEGTWVPITIGFSANMSDYYVVGTAETTPSRPNTVELKFGKAKLSTKPNKWKKLVNKQARKGFILSQVESADNTGTNFITVFAKTTINGEFARRKCAVERILLNDFDKMVQRLNAKGKKGFEGVIVTFGGGFSSFQFVLCKEK